MLLNLCGQKVSGVLSTWPTEKIETECFFIKSSFRERKIILCFRLFFHFLWLYYVGTGMWEARKKEGSCQIAKRTNSRQKVLWDVLRTKTASSHFRHLTCLFLFLLLSLSLFLFQPISLSQFSHLPSLSLHNSISQSILFQLAIPGFFFLILHS